MTWGYQPNWEDSRQTSNHSCVIFCIFKNLGNLKPKLTIPASTLTIIRRYSTYSPLICFITAGTFLACFHFAIVLYTFLIQPSFHLHENHLENLLNVHIPRSTENLLKSNFCAWEPGNFHFNKFPRQLRTTALPSNQAFKRHFNFSFSVK